MIKATVLYPNTPGSKFDMEYYLTTHMKLVRDRAGDAVKSFDVQKITAGGDPNSPPPYRVITTMVYDSMEALGSVMGPHGKEFAADMPNFTDVIPEILIGEVVA